MRYNSIFPLLMEIDRDQIPIFIPTFNQPSLLEMTLKQLDSAGLGNTAIVYDNNSTYRPMIDFLENISDKYNVVFSSKNTGPRIFTEDIQIMNLLPEFYIVTDPDLIWNKNLPEDFISNMKSILKRNKLTKVGFALDIDSDDQKQKFISYDNIYEWEHHYWKNRIEDAQSKDPVFDAWIDTTFSLNHRDSCIYYRKFNVPTFRYPSARIAGRYTAQHIGWWKKELQPQNSNEIDFYLKTQKWSHTENYYYKDLK